MTKGTSQIPSSLIGVPSATSSIGGSIILQTSPYSRTWEARIISTSIFISKSTIIRSFFAVLRSASVYKRFSSLVLIPVTRDIRAGGGISILVW